MCAECGIVRIQNTKIMDILTFLKRQHALPQCPFTDGAGHRPAKEQKLWILFSSSSVFSLPSPPSAI
jgi:hypothetical protein